MPDERQLIARATADAIIATAAADSIEAPQALLDALAKIERDTGERVLKVGVGKTSRRCVPDRPLPRGMSRLEWSGRRLAGTLTPDLPGVRVVDRQPCYELHVSGNALAIETALQALGIEAFSSAPHRVSVRLPAVAAAPRAR